MAYGLTHAELEEVRSAIDWLDDGTAIYEGSDASTWEAHQRWAEENKEPARALVCAQITHLLRTIEQPPA